MKREIRKIRDKITGSEEDKDRMIEAIRDEERKKILYLIKCEIGCIQDGDVLTPPEQEQCLKVARNIIKRIQE